MAREPDVALLMTAPGSLDIVLTRLLRMKLFLQFSYKAISNTMQHQRRINSKKHAIKEKIQTFAIA